VAVCGSALPARRKTGTSAQRQLSIFSRSATLAQQPVQPGVQLASRGQVVAERLLDRDSALAQEPGRAEVLHDGAEQGRGHLQVVQRPLCAADPRGEAAVERGVGDVAVQVGHPAGEPAEDRVVDLLAGVGDGLAGVLDEFPGGHVLAGHPDDRAVEQPAALQAVEGGEGHPAG
jgi:hypothetical protein